MKNIEAFIAENTPEPLKYAIKNTYKKLNQSCNTSEKKWLITHFKNQPHQHQQLSKIMIGSVYAFEYYCKYPQVLIKQLDYSYIDKELSKKIISEHFQSLKDKITNQTLDALNQQLRQQRHFFITLIIWRELNHLSSFTESTQALSALAENCVQIAAYFFYQQLSKKYGKPIGIESKKIQTFIVIGMGKLGGKELNLSSDIDLIFTYPESGMTDGDKTVENQVFFTRLGQAVIKTLNQVTVDGFVFRIDMRLRPYGQGGELVSNFKTLQHYYETQGRDWERFAMLKARIIANIDDQNTIQKHHYNE